jgi:hypothetical protein
VPLRHEEGAGVDALGSLAQWHRDRFIVLSRLKPLLQNA